MTKARLLSTVAATLLLGVGVASAQTMKKDEAPAPAPAAQQSAPAEKVAPAMKAGEKNADTHKAPATVGQAPKADAGKADAGKAQATDKGAMDKNAGAKSDVKSDADVKSKAAETKAPDAKAPETKASESKATETKAKENTAQDASGSKASQSTTGQGAAAGSAKLSTEQRTKITTIIKQKKVEPAHLTVSISVGTRVPDSVHFYPLPTEVIVIYPEWRGYDYILVGDQILVVDPRTHQIVAILEA
jgi:Protein of unknown function (DUF1236)